MKQNNRTSLIFLHGFRGTSEGLQPILAYFNPKKYNIYAPDLPPFGQADSLNEYTPKSYADYVTNFVKENDIAKPVLIGHSMGTIVAAITAAEYPQLFSDKLVLLSPITEKPRKALASLQPLVVLLPNKTLGWLSTKYLFIPKDRSLYKKSLDVTYKCGSKFISRKDVKEAAAFSAQNCIKDFNWPQKTLIIVGAQDKVIPPSKTLSFAKTREAETLTIKNAGHLINYETPREVAQAIQSWLEQ